MLLVMIIVFQAGAFIQSLNLLCLAESNYIEALFSHANEVKFSDNCILQEFNPSYRGERFMQPSKTVKIEVGKKMPT